MTAARIGPLLLISMTAGVACKAPATVPEPGAALVRVRTTASAPQPDELRAWVYDDGGRIWDSVRIPETGALAVTSAAELGTVLIQPSGTARGVLRVHVRGFAAGTRVLDGFLSMAEAGRDQKTFDLVLDPAVLADEDGDDVPDAIDDCLRVFNPLQGGCAVIPTIDAGSTIDAGGDAQDAAAGDTAVDSPVDTSTDASTDVVAMPDVKPDVSLPDLALPDLNLPDLGLPKATGVACAGNGECATGFCVDGVCCASACKDVCHACNQTGKVGACQNFAQGADPEHECGTGMTCNGAGACATTPPPPKKQLGNSCAGGTECLSGFCADKVCCDSACAGACQNCGSGVCTAVKRMDDVPECSGSKTCNSKGTCASSSD